MPEASAAGPANAGCPRCGAAFHCGAREAACDCARVGGDVIGLLVSIVSLKCEGQDFAEERGLHLRAFGGREGRLHAAQALLQRHLSACRRKALCALVQHQLAGGRVVALRACGLQPGIKTGPAFARPRCCFNPRPSLLTGEWPRC